MKRDLKKILFFQVAKMYSEKKKRLEGAKQRLTNPPKKKKRRKPVKVIASTVENDDESDEDKVYVLKSIADDLCQPQVRKRVQPKFAESLM